MTIAGHLPSLPDLTYAYGGLVYPVGGSIHRFLAERYGEWRILELYNDIYKYSSFDGALAGVYGRTIDQLSDEWQYWMRQHYYPAVTTQPPLAITARKLTELAIKPTAYRLPGDSAPSFLFFSPASGYTTIYAQNLSGRRRRAVVQGERSEQFESFHFFESRIDVSARGVATFSSKYAERTRCSFGICRKARSSAAISFRSSYRFSRRPGRPMTGAWCSAASRLGLLRSLSLVARRHGRFARRGTPGAAHLRSLRGPRSDHQRGRADRRLSSDRTPFGKSGARNLFALDLPTGAIRYLTYGDWRDESPRWGGGRIYFASDRDGTFQVYSIDSVGTGRRETRTLNGAFDPQFVPGEHGGLLFGGFADLTFSIYVAAPLNEATSTFTLANAPDSLPAPAWTWGELSHPQYARTDGAPYERKFSLDFAAGDAAVAPVSLGAGGGIRVQRSPVRSSGLFLADVVPKRRVREPGGQHQRSAFYLNQSRRINWGGAFRQRGLFYEGDFNSLFEERSYGMIRAGALSVHALPAYRRRISSRALGSADIRRTMWFEPRRVGWLASNYLTYVKDNTLWLPHRPIDGERYNLTTGLVNDLSHGRFDSWLVSATGASTCVRRSTARSPCVSRGTHRAGRAAAAHQHRGLVGLRGYPQYGYVAGTRAWLVNAEYRFPILDS